MELIILNDGLYSLVKVSKEMTEGIEIFSDIDCFDLCDIIRIEFTTYMDYPTNQHIMNDESGSFVGCMCR